MMKDKLRRLKKMVERNIEDKKTMDLKKKKPHWLMKSRIHTWGGQFEKEETEDDDDYDETKIQVGKEEINVCLTSFP